MPRSPRRFTGVRDLDFPDYDYSGRLDWNLPRTQTLTSRYQWTHQLRETEEVIVGENALQDNKQQNLGMTWTHMFSNALVGEARYGLGLRSTNVDIQAGNDTPIVRFTGTPVSGAIIGNAGKFPINRDQTDHQFVYNLTAQLFTNHSFRLGIDIRRQALDDVADNNSRGFWTFNDCLWRDDLRHRVTPRSSTAASPVHKGYGPFFLENRMNESNVYVQDDWRIRDQLTLNLGLRYEYVRRADGESKIASTTSSAPTTTISSRASASPTRPPGRAAFSARSAAAPDSIAFHAGYGIYDGRIFQSVFSQGGANVRFNPPNAMLARTLQPVS